jgi:thiol-disulfide isomerase/thioredoxin
MRTALLTVGLGLAACLVRAQETPGTFPDLELAGADGSSVRLSELKGNVVLLNVWATWCGPCRLELPIVQKMYDRYSDRNFVVLAVNIDADRRRIEPFLKHYNLSLPIYYAAPEEAGAMTEAGIPSTFILGPNRALIDRAVGYSPDVEERWKQVIEKHLKTRKASAR